MQLKLGNNLALDEVCKFCRGQQSKLEKSCRACDNIGYTLTEAGKVLCELLMRHTHGQGSIDIVFRRKPQ